MNLSVLVHSRGKALWPEWYPVDVLETVKKRDPASFEALYQQNPVPAGGALLKEAWWLRYTVLPALSHSLVTVDSAFKTGVRNDFSALALWGKGRADGHAYLVDAEHGRWEFPELLDRIYAFRERNGVHRPGVVIEDKASGQSALQVIRSEGPTFPLIAHAVPSSTSKVARTEAITQYIEGGMAHIPERAPWLDDWLLEHNRAPSGANDDWVDTTVMALERLLGVARPLALPPDPLLRDHDAPAVHPMSPGRKRLRDQREARELADLERWRAQGIDI